MQQPYNINVLWYFISPLYHLFRCHNEWYIFWHVVSRWHLTKMQAYSQKVMVKSFVTTNADNEIWWSECNTIFVTLLKYFSNIWLRKHKHLIKSRWPPSWNIFILQPFLQGTLMTWSTHLSLSGFCSSTSIFLR